MSKRIALILVLALSVLTVMATAQLKKPLTPMTPKPVPPPVPVITATVNVTSPTTDINGNCSGNCPVTIRFTGTIQVHMACAVQYRFNRSDGLMSSTVNLNCPGAGSYSAKDEWTVSTNTSGGEVLEVLSPVSVKSNQAAFHFTCAPTPVITGVESGGGDMIIWGKNLGQQGTRDISIGGKLVSQTPGYKIDSWGTNPPTAIFLQTANDLIPLNAYGFVIMDGGKMISNIYDARILFSLWVKQDAVPAGGTLSVGVYQLPLSQSAMGLRLYSEATSGLHYDLPTISWTGGAIGAITASVPAGAVPGKYDVTLIQNGTVVSYCCNFVVTITAGE